MIQVLSKLLLFLNCNIECGTLLCVIVCESSGNFLVVIDHSDVVTVCSVSDRDT